MECLLLPDNEIALLDDKFQVAGCNLASLMQRATRASRAKIR